MHQGLSSLEIENQTKNEHQVELRQILTQLT
jgi:hypothetical protein